MTTHAGGAPPIDIDALLERVRGDRELAGAMAVLCLELLPGQLDDVKHAVAAHDAEALSRTAHALKGTVANFSAEPSRAAAERLEVMGRASDLSGAAAALRTLEHELDRLGPALRELTG